MSAASSIRALGVHAVRGVVSVVGVAFMACADAGSSGHDSVDASPTCSDVSFESAQLWPSRNILAPSDCSAPAESTFPDQCACAALACDTGETCVLVDQFSDPGTGGSDTIANVCLTLCYQDGDCLAPTVCVPNVYGLEVCAAPGCETDADCAADPCGTCVPGVVRGRSSNWLDPSASHCVYSGACGPASCDGCTDRAGDPSAPGTGGHVCAP